MDVQNDGWAAGKIVMNFGGGHLGKTGFMGVRYRYARIGFNERWSKALGTSSLRHALWRNGFRRARARLRCCSLVS